MKITRRQLNILIEKYTISEITPDIYHDPVRASAQAKHHIKALSPTQGQFFLVISEIMAGFVPVIGQAIDIKDLGIALKKVFESGGDEGKIETAIAAFAFIPGIGDAAKAAYRAAKTAAKATKKAQKVTSNAMKVDQAIADKLAEDELRNKAEVNSKKVSTELAKKHPDAFI